MSYRCYFDVDTGTFIVTYTTPAHDNNARYIAETFVNYISLYPELRKNVDWEQSFTFNVSFEEGTLSSGDPDFAIYKGPLRPYFVVEVAFSQKGVAAVRKCERWLKGQPTIAGAVVVNIQEEVRYRRPSASYEPLSQISFEAELDRVLSLGGVITVGGHDWFKMNTCTVEALTLRGNGDIVTDKCVR